MRRVSCFVSLAVLLAVVNHAPVFAQTAAPGFTLEGTYPRRHARADCRRPRDGGA